MRRSRWRGSESPTRSRLPSVFSGRRRGTTWVWPATASSSTAGRRPPRPTPATRSRASSVAPVTSSASTRSTLRATVRRRRRRRCPPRPVRTARPRPFRSGIRLAAATGTTVILAWQPASDNVGVVGYGLYVGGLRVGSTSDASATISDLACGRSYGIGVDAVDAAGNRSARTTAYFSTAACVDAQAPSVPTGLAATSTASGVTLSWSPSTDNVAVAGYGLYRAGSSVATTTATTASLSGLSCGTAYSLAVDSFDAAGNRSPKAALSVTTAGCSPPPTGGADWSSNLKTGDVVTRGTVWKVTVTPTPDEVDLWASGRMIAHRHARRRSSRRWISQPGDLQARVLSSQGWRAEVRDDRAGHGDRRADHRRRLLDDTGRHDAAVRSRLAARRLGHGDQRHAGVGRIDRRHGRLWVHALPRVEQCRHNDADERHDQRPDVRHRLHARRGRVRRRRKPVRRVDRLRVHAGVRADSRHDRLRRFRHRCESFRPPRRA